MSSSALGAFRAASDRAGADFLASARSNLDSAIRVATQAGGCPNARRFLAYADNDIESAWRHGARAAARVVMRRFIKVERFVEKTCGRAR